VKKERIGDNYDNFSGKFKEMKALVEELQEEQAETLEKTIESLTFQ